MLANLTASKSSNQARISNMPTLIGLEETPLKLKKEVSLVSQQAQSNDLLLGEKPSYDTNSKQVHRGKDQRLPAQTELLILWTISSSGSRGVYGLDIQRAINECSMENECISVGTLYSSLKRLRSRGFITSVEGDPIAGGAKRQYYHLTSEGEAVVSYANGFISKLAAWVPEREQA